MRHAFFYSFKTKVTLVLILAMVLVMGLHNFYTLKGELNTQFEQLRNFLKVIAGTAAVAVNPENLREIPMERGGVQSPAYREVARHLIKILDMNEPLQYIYILSKTETEGALRFLVDVESSSDRGRRAYRKRKPARPGDLYDARAFPEMIQGFMSATSDRAVEHDAWGMTLSGYAPILDRSGKTVAILGVDIMADDIGRMQDELKRRMLVVFLIGILICCVLGILISESVSGPVRRLVEGTRQLSAGNLDYRVKLTSRDEIGELAHSFNIMAGKLRESRERLRDYFFKVTHSLVRALEAKDPYTQGHSARVAELSYKTALKLGMELDKAELLRYVAELHDIGKLMIHESILTKKEKLEDSEWQALRDHPATGEKILKSVLDEELLRVIRSHHERVDGKGYPDGLKGDEIDLSSQIVGIADAYDAMTSTRPYRVSVKMEAAIVELNRVSGTQFRSDVVNAFIQVIRSGA